MNCIYMPVFFTARQIQKKIAEVEGRAQAEAKAWDKAGKGPIVKTYTYDPTKVKSTATGLQ